MSRFGVGLAPAIACIAFGASAVQAQHSGATPGAGRPASITPGNNSGSRPPGTTADSAGASGRTVPGIITNTPLQRSQDNTTSTAPPAVTTSNANRKTAAAPVKGANNFTMNEARRRIESGGFSQVTGLKQDGDGIWRDTAMRDGASVPVYCDNQGNVGAS